MRVPTWMVIGLGIWILISLFVVAVCIAARRIDERLGRRPARVLEPLRREPPSRPRARVE
jgi:hypothetical protein